MYPYQCWIETKYVIYPWLSPDEKIISVLFKIKHKGTGSLTYNLPVSCDNLKKMSPWQSIYIIKPKKKQQNTLHKTPKQQQQQQKKTIKTEGSKEKPL